MVEGLVCFPTSGSPETLAKRIFIPRKIKQTGIPDYEISSGILSSSTET